jgi:hypothetical protein
MQVEDLQGSGFVSVCGSDDADDGDCSSSIMGADGRMDE